MSGKIMVVGLGSGDLNQLSIGIYRLLQKATNLYVRTEEHPVVRDLRKEGMQLTTFDDVYIKHDDFEAVYEDITERLLETARGTEIVYAVPGHPMVAEKTVQLLLEKGPERGIEIHLAGGQSFLDPMLTALEIDPIEGLQFLDALSLDPDHVTHYQHLIICQIYDGFVASEVKLVLLEHYPPDYVVTLIQAAGDPDQKIKKVLLAELDFEWTLDNRTSLYVPPIQNEELANHSFPRLRKIIQTLRSPMGCPWDREQTHHSLKKYLIEEAYEVIEAIDDEDDDHLAEELGDLLLQIMLHAQIGEDEGYFNIYDVIRHLSDKMIRRHPHVFGEETVQSAGDVVLNWDKIKATEKSMDQKPPSLLSTIGKGLPTLLYASELQKKAAKVGFDWPSTEEVWNKIYEELEECKAEEKVANLQKLESEIGDVLFSIVNLARKYSIDPEVALLSTNNKFKKRFSVIEEEAERQGRALTTLTLEEMDQIWESAKENLK